MTTRAAFLRSLPACGFVPPEADVAALGGELPAGAAADRFAADVRAFAVEFWALAPPDRRARWEALTARAAGPAAARLGELRRALDVTAAAPADPAAAELAALGRELFVLPPRERTARREAWLATHADDLPRYAITVVTGDTNVRFDRWLSERVVDAGAPALVHRLRLVESLDRRRRQRQRQRQRDTRGFVERCLDLIMVFALVIVMGLVLTLSLFLGQINQYYGVLVLSLGLTVTLYVLLRKNLRPPATPSARTPGRPPTGRGP
jgi:hypothetical protein